MASMVSVDLDGGTGSIEGHLSVGLKVVDRADALVFPD